MLVLEYFCGLALTGSVQEAIKNIAVVIHGAVFFIWVVRYFVLSLRPETDATQARDAKQGPPRSEGIVPFPEVAERFREKGEAA